MAALELDIEHPSLIPPNLTLVPKKSEFTPGPFTPASWWSSPEGAEWLQMKREEFWNSRAQLVDTSFILRRGKVSIKKTIQYFEEGRTRINYKPWKPLR